jgi:excisionase family DNA binding protein
VNRAGDDREHLTSTEAGELLGVSAATVKRWSNEGALASVRTRGGHRRFRRFDVQELAARLRSDGGATATLADRLAAREGVLRIQAEILAERARCGSWRLVIEDCVSTLLALSAAQRGRGAPHLATRIAQRILEDALVRCADELPVTPGAPGLVIAALEDEPFTAPLALAQLAARAAGWNAWSVGAVPATEIAAFADAGDADALLLFASAARSVADALALVAPACARGTVAFAAVGDAAWSEAGAPVLVLGSLAEVEDWLRELPKPPRPLVRARGGDADGE